MKLLPSANEQWARNLGERARAGAIRREKDWHFTARAAA